MIRKGRQSWLFASKPIIRSSATAVGPFEGRGPLQRDFDRVHEESTLEKESWEKAERKLMEEAGAIAIEKAGITKDQIQFFIGGDLMNQITSTSFAARTFGVPYLGIFGACSSSMEGLALASLLIETEAADIVLTGTCSHNASVEKQFRYPTEYGSQKPPTAQYTVTGAGAAVLTAEGEGPVVSAATVGRVIDMGVSDPFNMGAAMAPAAVDTIESHFRDLGRTWDDYDLVVTGDLAQVGYDIACELFQKHENPFDQQKFKDCGLMIYNREEQEVQAGGSGCGCSAVVTYGHLLKQMQAGHLQRILVVATGALLSPLTYQQGDSIPCIAHAVAIEREA